MFKSLKNKVSMIYCLLVALIIAVGCLSVGNIALIQVSINNIMTANYRSIQLSQSMLSVLSDQNQSIIGYVTTGDQSEADSFYRNVQLFMENMTGEENNISQNGEQDLVDRVNIRYTDLQNKFSTLQAIRSSRGNVDAMLYYHDEVSPVYTYMAKKIEDISKLNQAGLAKSDNKTSDKATLSLYQLLTVTFAAAVLGLFLSRYFANRFLHPLQQLSRCIRELKEGTWDLKLNIKTNDEVGQLAKEFNSMTERLSLFEQSRTGALLREKNQSIAIVRSISDPLIVLDNNYKITLMNSACERFFDIFEADTVGKHFLESIHRGDLFDIISSCPATEPNRTEKIIHIDKNGVEYYFNIVVAPIKSADNAGYVFLMQDVTDFKQLEHAKNEFIATISHEFKTPLTSIIMGVSMLQDSHMGTLSSDQNEVIETIAEYSQLLADLVNEMLELARIESGKAVYHLEPCSLEEIVHNSTSLFNRTSQINGIRFHTVLEPNPPTIFADPGKLTWVLNNLLSNAFKYTRPGGTITIEAHSSDQFMYVSVTDNGEGIPPEFINRVFDKYVQAPTEDLEARGTGLGLYAARTIVEEHKGTITVQSELGKGSIFTFSIPIYQEVLECNES